MLNNLLKISDNEKLESFLKFAPFLIIAIHFLYSALTIMTFPPVHYLGDELGMLMTGSNFIESLLSGNVPNHITPRLFYTSLWVLGKTIGVGVVQFRMLSLLASLGVLWLVFLLGRQLGGRGAGLLAMLIVTGDYTFAWNSRLIRPEMLTIHFILGSFTALVLASQRDNSLKLVFVSALLVSLSINVHPNNLQYVVVMLFMYPVLFREKLLSKNTLIYAAGFMAGFAFWILWSYLPSISGAPASAASQLGVIDSIARSYPFPILNENFIELFVKSLNSFYMDYITIYLKMANTTFPNSISFKYYAMVTALAIIAGLIGKNRLKVLMLVGFPASALFFNYFLTNKFGYWHMVEAHVFLSLAMAIGVSAGVPAGLSAMADKLNARLRQVSILALVCALVLVGYLDQFRSIKVMSKNYSYTRLINRVSAAVPSKGEDVMGHILYSPAFNNKYTPLGFDVEKQKSSFKRCGPFAERVQSAGIRYFLMDDIIRGMMTSSCGKIYYKSAIRWLSLNASLKASINEPYPNFWAPGKQLKNIYIYELSGFGKGKGEAKQ
jgi:4-amino-4-deoxy-L-arabinose transferase-like glycosyltransferase